MELFTIIIDICDKITYNILLERSVDNNVGSIRS